jgi:hypothetical protein
MALSHNPSLVTEGLIIYLDANNTSSYAGTGTTWYDLSGNGRHASLISSPSYEGFGGGKYLSFDGSTNFATIPYTITDNLITVSFWYYSKIFSANSFLDALISNYTNGISGFDVRLNSSTTINLAIVIAASESQISIGAITNNTWYHVAFTYDGATVKTYLDAVFKSSTNVVGTRANGTQICIGTSAYDTNRKATCGIPQVMIYNRALSDTEMLQNYNATKGRYIVNENIVRDGLILNLDAGNTRSYPGTGNTAYDISGTGITASLVNGVGFNNANNGSFLFDGTNDQISTSNINLSSTNKVTVSCWVKVLNYRETADSSNIVFEFSSNFNSNIGAFVAGFADGSAIYSSLYPVVLGIRGNSGYNLAGYSKTLVNDLSWHHWACIFDTSLSGNENILYIDGVSRTAISTPLQADNSANFGSYNLYIGNRDTSTIAGNANIADLKLYNRALTAQEVRQNYNATKNRYGL